MPICPYCKRELERIDEGKYYCENCNRYFRPQRSAPQTPPSQPAYQQPTYQQPAYQQPAYNPPSNDGQDEIDELKARIAALENENRQIKRQQRTYGNTASKAQGVFSNIWEFFKRHAKIILPVTLLVIAFITLMTTLVGIRGVYVNVDDPNDFYSFTATSYVGYVTDEFGDSYVEKGTWKTSGNKIIFTVKDEDFGTFSADFLYSTKNGNKTLFIGEDKDSLVEYKRVSLVKYDINTQKAKVSFDMNGGDGENSTTKIKIGSKLKEPSAKPTHPDGYDFRGWYSSPYGYKNSLGHRFSEEYRIWGNTTYYANWYNPNEYSVTVSDEFSTLANLSLHEGDAILAAIQSQIDHKEWYSFYLNNQLIDEHSTMPAKDVTIRFEYTDVYWTKLEYMFEFTLLKNNTYEFSTYRGRDETVTIPAVFRNKPVTCIGENALVEYNSSSSVVNVIIPKTITAIKDGAFNRCNKLEAVYITDIEKWCEIVFGFDYANPLGIAHNLYLNGELVTNLVIPNSVTRIHAYAFYGCYSLTSVTIPNGVTMIGESAFAECSELTSITIQDNVMIGPCAFYNCTRLQDIHVPNSITNISTSAFYNTSWYNNQPDGMVYLGKVAYNYKGTMPDGTSISIKEDTLAIAGGAFTFCRGLISITIPTSIQYIGDVAFSDCDNLTNIIITNGLTGIGYHAFYDCPNLISITFNGTKAQWKAIYKTHETYIWNEDEWAEWYPVDDPDFWDSDNTSDFIIHCTDGDLDKDGNEI